MLFLFVAMHNWWIKPPKIPKTTFGNDTKKKDVTLNWALCMTCFRYELDSDCLENDENVILTLTFSGNNIPFSQAFYPRDTIE